MPEAGSPLAEACPANGHILTRTWYTYDEFNPECFTCTTRVVLNFHDHLHLDGKECVEPGLGGTPGVNVRCRCGSFHH